MLKCIYRTGRLILESTKTSASTKVSNEIRELSVPHHLPVYAQADYKKKMLQCTALAATAEPGNKMEFLFTQKRKCF